MILQNITAIIPSVFVSEVQLCPTAFLEGQILFPLLLAKFKEQMVTPKSFKLGLICVQT